VRATVAPRRRGSARRPTAARRERPADPADAPDPVPAVDPDPAVDPSAAAADAVDRPAADAVEADDDPDEGLTIVSAPV
jgi:hypothetical protein